MAMTGTIPTLTARIRVRSLGATQTEVRWLLWPPLIFFVFALGLPMVALIMQSFGTGGTAYGDMFSVPAFTASLTRTIVMAVVVTVITTVLGGAYALAIASSPTWFRIFLLAALLHALWT